jgi:hypothetical protein
VPHPSSTYEVSDGAVEATDSVTGIQADTNQNLTIIDDDTSARVLYLRLELDANATANAQLDHILQYEVAGGGGYNLVLNSNVSNTSDFIQTRQETILQRQYPLLVPTGVKLVQRVRVSTPDSAESYDMSYRVGYEKLNDQQKI